jgi:hypothetical protein
MDMVDNILELYFKHFLGARADCADSYAAVRSRLAASTNGVANVEATHAGSLGTIHHSVFPGLAVLYLGTNRALSI